MSTNKFSVITIVVLLAGCATTDGQEFKRTADLIEARESFATGKESCRDSGRTAFIKADATRIKRERSDSYDYRFAYCD